MKNLQRLIPILEWLPNYTRSRFKGDFIAGITVAIILIPQGIAYALIAGLPPIYGLYCALVPQLVYWSSSHGFINCSYRSFNLSFGRFR